MKKFYLSYPWLILLLIFVTVFLVYFQFSKVITSSDSRWSVHTAQSIVKQGNTRIEQYTDPLEKTDSTIILDKIDNYSYSVYPIGASLLAVPFVFGLDKIGYNVIANYFRVELLVASVIVALTALFIYLIARLFLGISWSLLLTFILAFCTSAWSTASRALWQHGPSMLALSITLYLLVRAYRNPRWAQFASIPLAFAFVCRPTNSLSVLLLSLFVLIQFRRYFLAYLLWSLVVAIPFVAFNFSVYHNLLSPYYRGSGVGSGFSIATFPEALAGTVVSPSRGLFIFTPILLFSIWGFFLKWRSRQIQLLDHFLVAIIVLHWVTVSFWVVWWAGHSYGPRIFSDVIPYFVYFLIPVLERLSKTLNRYKIVFSTIFAIALVISFFIHYRGATNFEVYQWNVNPPTDVSLRVWDWRDPQFLRGL